MIQNFFLNKTIRVYYSKLRLYIPRGTVPYVVTAQHGIPGTACGDDFSLSNSPYTAKNSHLNLVFRPKIHPVLKKKSVQAEVIQFVPNSIFFLFTKVRMFEEGKTEASSHQA